MLKGFSAAAAAFTLLAVAACDREGDKSEEAVTEADETAQAEGVATAAWPDGWVVVSKEEWIPVQDDAGQSLHAARAHFARGERSEAAAAVRKAISEIDGGDAYSPEDKKQLESVKAELEKLATRLEGTEEVTLADIDKALTDAYRTDVAVDWIYLKEESWALTFERPSEHFDRALRLLDEGENEEAADEIRRGAGYFRLAAGAAAKDQRERLMQQVQKLTEAAKSAEDGKLEAKQLRKVLVETNDVFAESYLHEAEQSWAEKQVDKTRRALREADARLRASARWLGSESQDATRAVQQQLEKLGGKLKQGTNVATEELQSAVQAVRDFITTNRKTEESAPKR